MTGLVTPVGSATSHQSLQDVFVLDSTVHGYNTRVDNYVDSPYKDRVAAMLSDTLWKGHRAVVPFGDERYLLEREQFRNGADPHLLAHALFAESDTDMCIYHGVPLYGIFKDGGSPLWVGQRMRELHPGRVALYGPVSPWQPDALEVVEQLIVEERRSSESRCIRWTSSTVKSTTTDSTILRSPFRSLSASSSSVAGWSQLTRRCPRVRCRPSRLTRSTSPERRARFQT